MPHTVRRAAARPGSRRRHSRKRRRRDRAARAPRRIGSARRQWSRYARETTRHAPSARRSPQGRSAYAGHGGLPFAGWPRRPRHQGAARAARSPDRAQAGGHRQGQAAPRAPAPGEPANRPQRPPSPRPRPGNDRAARCELVQLSAHDLQSSRTCPRHYAREPRNCPASSTLSTREEQLDRAGESLPSPSRSACGVATNDRPGGRGGAQAATAPLRRSRDFPDTTPEAETWGDRSLPAASCAPVPLAPCASPASRCFRRRR